MPVVEPEREFSNLWLVISIVLFCALELFFGGYVGRVLIGKYVSQMLLLKLQVMLNLGSYFLGGIIIGLVSPGVRVIEPAVGAAVSVAMALMISLFLPYRFMHISMGKMFLGGGIAFVLAMVGARFGEKLMGNIAEDE